MNSKITVLKKVIAYIVLALMIFMSLFPVAFCLSASLRTQQDYAANMLPFSWKSLFPTEFTLENYKNLFTGYNFGRPIFNTLLVTSITIVVSCFVNAIAGFAFTFFDFKGKKLVYPLVLLSFMVPFESIAIPLYTIAGKLGIIDTYSGMILPAIADGLVAFLFIQFFKDLPISVIEAARVDGASWMTIIWKIVFPISIPVFVTAGLMIFMNQWNSYMWPLLVARSKEIRTIQLAITAFAGERNVKWTLIFAGSLVSAIIPMCIFMPFQKYYVEGITSGSVKG